MNSLCVSFGVLGRVSIVTQVSILQQLSPVLPSYTTVPDSEDPPAAPVTSVFQQTSQAVTEPTPYGHLGQFCFAGSSYRQQLTVHVDLPAATSSPSTPSSATPKGGIEFAMPQHRIYPFKLSSRSHHLKHCVCLQIHHVYLMRDAVRDNTDDDDDESTDSTEPTTSSVTYSVYHKRYAVCVVGSLPMTALITRLLRDVNVQHSQLLSQYLPHKLPSGVACRVVAPNTLRAVDCSRVPLFTAKHPSEALITALQDTPAFQHLLALAKELSTGQLGGVARLFYTQQESDVAALRYLAWPHGSTLGDADHGDDDDVWHSTLRTKPFPKTFATADWKLLFSRLAPRRVLTVLQALLLERKVIMHCRQLTVRVPLLEISMTVDGCKAINLHRFCALTRFWCVCCRCCRPYPRLSGLCCSRSSGRFCMYPTCLHHCSSTCKLPYRSSSG